MPQQSILSGVRHALRPLVRMLLRGGVGWGEFAELGKEVYVQVAREDYGIQGRPTNTSRVALITGMSRREVTRLKSVLLGVRRREEPAASRISQVLSAWHLDPDFLDAVGQPGILSLNDGGSGLTKLLKRYAGDTPHGAIIKELEELGLIEHGPAGYRVLSRDYIRGPTDPDLLRQASLALHDHADTIAFNVDAGRSGPPRFERMVTHPALPHRHQRAFEAFVASEGRALLERIDNWLLAHAGTPGEEAAAAASGGLHARRVGLGMYLIRDQQEGKQP